jgi:hypothetical protein
MRHRNRRANRVDVPPEVVFQDCHERDVDTNRPRREHDLLVTTKTAASTRRFQLRGFDVRVAAANIDIAYVGEGLTLSRLLVPAPLAEREAPAPAEHTTALVQAARETSHGSTTLYRTYWFRWWAKPSA